MNNTDSLLHRRKYEVFSLLIFTVNQSVQTVRRDGTGLAFLVPSRGRDEINFEILVPWSGRDGTVIYSAPFLEVPLSRR